MADQESELLWECKTKEKTLTMARRTLAILEQEAAAYPVLSMPPELQINLEEQRRKVVELESKINEIKAQLNGNISESGQQKKSSNQAKKPAKIKRNIIKGYNLDTLIYQLCQHISYEGAFAFTIGGKDREILDNYVIERIFEALPTKTRRTWKRHDIHIYESDLNIWREKIIEERLKAEINCQNFSDLFDFKKLGKTDILLIVWNYDIPLDNMGEMSVCCWQDMEQKSRQFLIGKSRCLVVIWANALAGESPLNNFTLLPVPDKFEDLENLAAWFGGELEQLELTEEVPESTVIPPINRSKRQLTIEGKQVELHFDLGQPSTFPDKPELVEGSHHFQLTPRLPMSQREMAEIWRQLRRPQRVGRPEELDVEGTIHSICRTGFLLRPVLRSRRRNQAKLVVLIDRLGSMAPFSLLVDGICESILRGGLRGRASFYYFHDCPDTYLYERPQLTGAVLLKTLMLEQMQGNSVLIVSDAGAAYGFYDRERREATKTFLNALRSYTYLYAWLNPLPESRWTATTAEDIKKFVPMFPFDPEGLHDTVNILRGYPSEECG